MSFKIKYYILILKILIVIINYAFINCILILASSVQFFIFKLFKYYKIIKNIIIIIATKELEIFLNY